MIPIRWRNDLCATLFEDRVVLFHRDPRRREYSLISSTKSTVFITVIGTHVYIYVPILAYFLASSAYLRMRFRGVTASEWSKAFVLSGLFFYISKSWYFRLVAALSSPSSAAWGVAGPKQLTRDPSYSLIGTGMPFPPIE